MPKRIAKALVFLIALVPAAMLVRSFLTDALGVNPAETIQLTTGRWALKFLLISLAVTPVRRLTGWNVVIQYRRMLGLFAFFYATVHFTSYLAFDLGFAWGAIVGDILKRPFITVGFTAFLLLVPLALTSTRASIRRLGFRRWQVLHQLAYVAGVLAVIHFIWRVKIDVSQPLVYAGILTALLAIRAVFWLRRTVTPSPSGRGRG
jgi:sulfoxide reductase heme-binding subunit YedZ